MVYPMANDYDDEIRKITVYKAHGFDSRQPKERSKSNDSFA